MILWVQGMEPGVEQESPKSAMINGFSSMVKELSGVDSPQGLGSEADVDFLRSNQLGTEQRQHKFIADADCSLLMRPLYPLVANQTQNGFGVLDIQVPHYPLRLLIVFTSYF